MPYVLTYNKEAISAKIISICDYLDLDKNFEIFLDWILDLRRQLDIPHRLSDVIDKNKIDVDKLANMALEDPSTVTNPKKLSHNDMKILYQHSITGTLFS